MPSTFDPDSAADIAPIDLVARGSERGWQQLRRTPALTWAAVRLVHQAAPRLLITSFLLQVVSTILLAAQLFLVKHLIGELAGLRSDETIDAASLAPVFAALLAANVGAGALTAVLASQQRLMADLVGHHTVQHIIGVSTRVGLAHFEDPDFHDRLERARTAAMFRPIELVNNLTTLITGLVSSIGLSIALLTLEPILLPVVLLAGVPVLIATILNSRHAHAFDFAMTVHAREHLHLMDVLTDAMYAKELRVFSATAFLRRRYDDLTRERLTRLRAFLHGRLVVSLVATVATGIGTAVALGSVVWLLATGRTGISTAVTAALAMQLLASRTLALYGAVGKIVEGGLFLEDYQTFLREPDTSEASEPEPEPDRRPAVPRFEGLSVEGLSFTYPLTGRRVLSDVSLELRPGEIVALVGENGSGKTTLVKLLCRLYSDPEAGRILLGGRDLRDLDARAVRDGMTVLFQDFVHYELTVSDNIRLGRPDAPGDEERIIDAARRAGAHEIIEQLPQGYRTRLGRRFHGGAELSGGQWQRLALARAFYRGGDLLILDEPTAALDPRAEYAFFEQVSELAAGRSVLLISHRFSSVRMADRIYVLEGGRIVEQGNHRELMEVAGLYAELYSLQATAYFGETA